MIFPEMLTDSVYWFSGFPRIQAFRGKTWSRIDLGFTSISHNEILCLKNANQLLANGNFPAEKVKSNERKHRQISKLNKSIDISMKFFIGSDFKLAMSDDAFSRNIIADIDIIAWIIKKFRNLYATRKYGSKIYLEFSFGQDFDWKATIFARVSAKVGFKYPVQALWTV